MVLKLKSTCISLCGINLCTRQHNDKVINPLSNLLHVIISMFVLLFVCFALNKICPMITHSSGALPIKLYMYILFLLCRIPS